MAVELLIKNEKTGASELVPVATQQVFRDYWKAGSTALNLRLVPLFEDGLFERKDIPELMSELKQLRSWFITSQLEPNKNFLTTRTDMAIAAFERVIKNPDLTIG